MPNTKAMQVLRLPAHHAAQASQLSMHHQAPTYESSVDSDSLLAHLDVPPAARLSMRSVSPCQPVTTATEPLQADPLNHVLTDMQSQGSILSKVVRPVDARADMDESCSCLQTATAAAQLVSGTGISIAGSSCSVAGVVDQVIAELVESSINAEVEGLKSAATTTVRAAPVLLDSYAAASDDTKAAAGQVFANVQATCSSTTWASTEAEDEGGQLKMPNSLEGAPHSAHSADTPSGGVGTGIEQHDAPSLLSKHSSLLSPSLSADAPVEKPLQTLPNDDELSARLLSHVPTSQIVVHTAAIVSNVVPIQTSETEGPHRRQTTAPQQALLSSDDSVLPAISDDVSVSFLPAAGGASPEGCAALHDDTDAHQAAARNIEEQLVPPAVVHQAPPPQNVQRHQEASTGAASASAFAEGGWSGLHSLGWVPTCSCSNFAA